MGETHYAICNLCDAICGLEIETAGRKILAIRGDRDDPFSRGHVCPKGTAHQDVYDDPDRLRRPVRRIGARWEELSWAAATAEVSRRLVAIQRQHGPDAVGIYYGNPVGHSYQTMLAVLGFLKLAGTRNVFSSSSVDAHPRMLVSRLLYGNQALLPVPDIERTDLLVVMGANPIVSNGSVMSAPNVKARLRAIRERGGRIIVIDPRHSETAAVADEHHFIRPGTDALLLLAVLHVLYEENRIADGIRGAVTGLDDLGRIARQYPPESVGAAVGIEADTIRALARSFAGAGALSGTDEWGPVRRSSAACRRG
jgi:anaerobic selenocysteine-containing dehydrogenase